MREDAKVPLGEYIEQYLPEDEDYTVEYEWVALSRSLHTRKRFAVVSFTSSLEEMLDDPTAPTMLDGSSDSIVYYCKEERENTDDEWTQVPNQYGDIWEAHN